MRLLTALTLAAAISGGGAALAANTMTAAPAAKPAVAAKTTSTTMTTSTTAGQDKKAVSKGCSDQANAKGLHGKARKEFRNKCKMTGGKAA